MNEPALDPVDFSQAATVAPTCQFCQTPLADAYWEVNGSMTCKLCSEEAGRFGDPRGSRAGRFLKAFGAGTLAAIAGALLWFAIAKLTGYEFSLIAIAIGWGVGKMVRWGSGHRGGWRYQVLAMGLTYLAIVATTVPQIIEGLAANEAEDVVADETTSPDLATASGTDKAAGVVVVAVVVGAIAIAAPFLGGFQNIMGIIIIAIGLWEAWRQNHKLHLEITGPYPLAAPTP